MRIIIKNRNLWNKLKNKAEKSKNGGYVNTYVYSALDKDPTVRHQ